MRGRIAGVVDRGERQKMPLRNSLLFFSEFQGSGLRMLMGRTRRTNCQRKCRILRRRAPPLQVGKVPICAEVKNTSGAEPYSLRAQWTRWPWVRNHPGPPGLRGRSRLANAGQIGRSVQSFTIPVHNRSKNWKIQMSDTLRRFGLTREPRCIGSECMVEMKTSAPRPADLPTRSA